MAGLSIREAVKHFDVSRPTLANDLKKGKVSGVKDGQGVWSIDHSELARVYKPRVTTASIPVDNPVNFSRKNEVDISTFDSPLIGQVEALRESLAEAEKRAAESEKRAAVAEALAEERKRILDETLKLIPPPSPLTPAPVPAPAPAPSLTSPRRWWLWGRG